VEEEDRSEKEHVAYKNGMVIVVPSETPKVELSEEEVEVKSKWGSPPFAAVAVIVGQLHEWECLTKTKKCQKHDGAGVGGIWCLPP